MSIMRQHEDGTWRPAEPMPWGPGLSWEVYRRIPGTRTKHEALLFDKDKLLVKVTARWRWLLRSRMRSAWEILAVNA